MAKITKRQKVNLIAKWKTGQYTKALLGRKYGLSETRVRDIVRGIDKENEELVEALTELTVIKRFGRSAGDSQEIDRAVAMRISTMESDNEIIGNNRKLLLESQKVLSDAFKDADVDIQNIKNVTSAIKDIEYSVSMKRQADTGDAIANMSVAKKMAKLKALKKEVFGN